LTVSIPFLGIVAYCGSYINNYLHYCGLTLATKTTEREVLYREYQELKNETQKVEQIRRSVAEIMQTESPERTARKSRDAEL